jgi:hypothetical protein
MRCQLSPRKSGLSNILNLVQDKRKWMSTIPNYNSFRPVERVSNCNGVPANRDNQTKEGDIIVESPMTDISDALVGSQEATDTGDNTSLDPSVGSAIQEADAHEAIDSFTQGLKNLVDLYFGTLRWLY